ncbi:hypothetical protein EG68_06238 [Paragonimus skrjabini miyazakii]|uniref:Major facilitator superfamily (MFS) profile domain-containing protein n=1 Tax=Paragonimus skrjabini miyazakii TaxID=59628 RepID=A0A8S9Z0U4_9TREM|nr:hypothetical protein EG68_06238 [Paragonimus skrjabini miyazakii]
MDKRSFLWIFIYLVVDIMAFSMVLPWLPSIFELFSGGKDILNPRIQRLVTKLGYHSAVLDSSRWNSGVLGGKHFLDKNRITGIHTSVFSFAQFVASPFAGAFSDAYGRKPVLIFLQVVSVLSYVLSAVYGSRFILFTLSRMLCGVSRANIAVLSALVGDQSESVTRTRAMAVVGAAYSVGFTVGPLVSVLCLKRLTDESVVSRLIFCLGMCAAVLNTLNMLLLYWIISEPLVKKDKKPVLPHSFFHEAVRLVDPRKLFCFRGMGSNPKSDNRLWQWSFVWFGYLMIFSGLEFSLLFLTRTRFGYTGRDQGYMFFFMGVLMIIVQGGLVRRFQAGNETRLCSLAFFTLSLATLIIGISQHPYTFHLGLSLWAFAAATFVPTFNGMVSLITGPDRQGHIMGVFRSLNALARALGPAVFSLLFWTSGDSPCFLISAVFLFVLGVSFLYMNRSFSHT